MAQRQRYSFSIETKNNQTVHNCVHYGTSQPDAEVSRKRQYPGCTVIDVKVG